MSDAPGARATFYELQAANRRGTVLVLVAYFAFVLFLGWGLDTFVLGGLGDGTAKPPVPFFTLFALAWGTFHALVSWFSGAREVLHATMARPARPEDRLEQQYLNVVDEMAIAAGIPAPKAYVVPDDDPNAFAVGRDVRHASIAVTRGLLEKLDREELQGVIGHEMAHVRNLDIRALTLVTALFGATMLLSDVARRGLHFGGGRRHRDSDSEGGGSGGGIMLAAFLLWVIVAAIAPLLARLLAMAVSRSREYLADATAAELTRNPLGLAGALRKIDAAHEPTQLISQGSAHLCITDPRGLRLNQKDGPLADWLGTHPPIARRVALLETMAGVLAPPPAPPAT